MKFLVYIDDKEASFSAFYRVLNLVKENDWVIIVAKVKFYRGIGHRSSHVMKHFTRLLDKKHIKNLTFIEYGSIKNIIKNKVKLLKIDMILIASHNSKTKRLCNYVSDNITCNLMIVREFVPFESYLIPPTGTTADYSMPSNMNPLAKNKSMMQSESMSSIDQYKEKNNNDLSIPINKSNDKQSTTTTTTAATTSPNKNLSSSFNGSGKGKESLYEKQKQHSQESSDESDGEEVYDDVDDSREYRLVSTPSHIKKNNLHKQHNTIDSKPHQQKSREVPSM